MKIATMQERTGGEQMTATIPQLWIWIGHPDDKLDVLRYVRATNSDILNNPAVAALRAEARGMQIERDEARDLLRGLLDIICSSHIRAAELSAQLRGHRLDKETAEKYGKIIRRAKAWLDGCCAACGTDCTTESRWQPGGSGGAE